MTRRMLAIGIVFMPVGLGLVATGTGCSHELFMYLTQERTGNVTIVFINDTPYRASFSYGGWNSLERNPPGAVNFQQLRLEAKSTHEPVDLACTRDISIATEEFYQRALDRNAHEAVDFDPDAFDTVVHFSDAPVESPLAAAPTVGTALGQTWRLGVDFACGDELIFTFVEDPDAPGGFRIDFAVIRAVVGP